MNQEFHNVKIELNDIGLGSVYLDGELVKGCTGIELQSTIGEPTHVTIHLVTMCVEGFFSSRIRLVHQFIEKFKQFSIK